MTSQLRFPLLLSLIGTLPFIAAATLAWLGPAAYFANVLSALFAYCAIVLSFLGGIQWGIGVSVSETAPKSAQTLFLLSVVPALLSWAMLFIDAPGSKIIVAIFLFGFAWAVDALLHLQKLIPMWFFRLRSITTPIVIASLLTVLPRA